MAEAPTFEVHVVTPDREVWSGDATYLVARSAAGDIGILAGHEQVLSVMGIGLVKIERPTTEPLIAACDGGFLSVSRRGDGSTRVDVLAEFVTLEADIREVDIEALERKAEELYAKGHEEAANIEAAKALSRRRIAG